MKKTLPFKKLASTGLAALACASALPASAKTYNFILAVPGIKATVQTSASVSAGSLSFGGVAVGASSSSQAVQLTNTGNVALGISGISASGNFSATQNCGSSLSVGGSCAINVVFSPLTSGPLMGSLSIATSANTYSIDLSGTGQQAVTAAAPTTLAFGSQAAASTSSALVATLTNSGTAAATLLTPTVTTPFAVASTTCGTSLAAGASCTYNVTYSPTAIGVSSGTLSIPTSVGAQTVTLTGTGYANILASGSTHTWSDGSTASSCYSYLNASGNYSYSGATGSGVYTITPSGGTAQTVYCDMTNDDGGWTLVMRGYGGYSGTWDVTTAVNASSGGVAGAATGTTTFKYADSVINQIRAGGTGIYRIQADTTYTYTRFFPSVTYGHLTKYTAGAAGTISYATTSWTGAFASTAAWIANSLYLGGLTDDNNVGVLYFDANRSATNWIVGNGAGTLCGGTTAGCNFDMWVR